MFTRDDLKNYKELGVIIAKGDFNLKGESIIKTASLIQWYGVLGKKLTDQITKDLADKEVAELKASVKPIPGIKQKKKATKKDPLKKKIGKHLERLS